MDKIFEKAKDLHVVSTKIYKKADDAYAYSNSACTTKVSAADLEEMFIKGLIIIDGDNTYTPVKLNVTSGGVATVTYVTADTTTATTAVLATLASEEYEAP